MIVADRPPLDDCRIIAFNRIRANSEEKESWGIPKGLGM